MPHSLLICRKRWYYVSMNKGWDFMDKEKYEKICFVIMPISDKQGYPSGHFTNVYEQIFKPAIVDAGFEPYRVDEDALSSSIIQKIYDGLSKAKMAICDLSSANPNVLYELGIRHSFDLPVVLVKDERTDFIFDISPINTIVYQSDRVYENVISARNTIKEAIMEMDSQSGKGTLLSVINTQKAVLNDKSVSEEDKTNLMISTILSEIRNLKGDFQKNIVDNKVGLESENEMIKYSTYYDGRPKHNTKINSKDFISKFLLNIYNKTGEFPAYDETISKINGRPISEDEYLDLKKYILSLKE